MEKIPPTRKAYPSKACRWCLFSTKQRKEVRKHCVGCDEKPGLHDGACYNNWHNMKKAELDAEDAPRDQQFMRPPDQVAPVRPVQQPTPPPVFSPLQTRGQRGRRDTQAGPSTGTSQLPQAGPSTGTSQLPQAGPSTQAEPSKKRPRREPAKKLPDGSYLMTDIESDADNLMSLDESYDADDSE